MKIFGGIKSKPANLEPRNASFEYIKDDIYLDGACQTLRPQPVLDAVSEYFRNYNACADRVKYQWGRQVDEAVESTREKVLKLLGKSSAEYTVAFTLNTTYGLNLILQQLSKGEFAQIVTSEIEHNSVFLSTITAAERLGKLRKVLPRKENGSLIYNLDDLRKSVVVVNSVSNIDGRVLRNLRKLAQDVHGRSGILIIDAAQAMTGDLDDLRKTDFDALCFSGHKMYAPSLGVIVIKNELLKSLQSSFVGGGMVERLSKDSFVIPEENLACRLEPGLQDFAGIVGLGSAIDWLAGNSSNLRKLQHSLYEEVFDNLRKIPEVNLINTAPSSIISFYVEGIDSHRLATFLSEQNIMVRSGYFCCHYYLQNVKDYPPLLRVSIGYQTTKKDIEVFADTLGSIIRNIK